MRGQTGKIREYNTKRAPKTKSKRVPLPRKRECARARTHPPILRYHQCGKPPEKYEAADSDNTNHGAEARSIPPEGLPTRGRKPEINGCLDKYIPTECPPLRKHGAAHAGKICRAVRRSPKIYVMCAGRRPATNNSLTILLPFSHHSHTIFLSV